MNSWINKFRSLVIASHKRHIIVADVDNLFTYIELKQEFENSEFTVLTANNDLDVRLHFELSVRDSLNRHLIVAPKGYYPLPDIESLIHFQSIGLKDLFPNLDPKAINGLSFNALCLLSDLKLYEELGYEKTLKFLLENLYNVDFDTLTKNKAKERVMNALITVLLEKNGINKPLLDFLTNLSRPYFPTLVSAGLSYSNLVSFIQSQWQFYVANQPCTLDFKEPLLNKNLGYLFSFELLKPIQVTPDAYQVFDKTLKLGVYIDEGSHNDNELEGAIEYLKQRLANIDDLAEQWFQVIQIFSNAKLKYFSTENQSLKEEYIRIETDFNKRFQRFIENSYNSLFSLSGVRKPFVVSRILEYIKAQNSSKKALFVIDGMNYWQSHILVKAIAEAGLGVSASASFAYIPTITAWSRQAIFKGAKPNLLENNSKERTLFEEYWIKQGFAAYQIEFRNMGVNEIFDVQALSHDINILGIVCNDLDELMHGAILGDDGLKLSTEHWVQKSGIVNLLKNLVRVGYHIYITADHGSIEAKGIKNLKLTDKLGVLSRSKRHLHFTNETLLQNFLEINPDLEIGRKELSLYLKNQEAFTAINNKVITHGGSHFWEVIVPFVTIYEQ